VPKRQASKPYVYNAFVLFYAKMRRLGVAKQMKKTSRRLGVARGISKKRDA
jgi:hypothetical protein